MSRRNRSFVSICHKPIYVKQALSHYFPNPLTLIPQILSQALPRSQAAIRKDVIIPPLPASVPSLVFDLRRPPSAHLEALTTHSTTAGIHQIRHHRRPPMAPFLRILAADLLQ
jgi:hypothetical protein